MPNMGLAPILAFTVFAACSEMESPVRPIPIAPTPTQPQPPAVVPAAVSELILSNLGLEVVPFIRPSDGQPLFWYSPRFRLNENSGLSGATIMRAIVSIGWDEGDPFGEDCWGTEIRLAPHGVSEAFGDNLSALGRCAPGIARREQTSGVFLEVVYADDAGREASAFGHAVRR